MRSHRHLGAVGKLTQAQKHLMPDFLWHGAEAYGFQGDVWTTGRIARVIEDEFGVRYHRSQVSRILKGLGWTPQVPVTRAIQRNEDAIGHWVQTVWPRLWKRALEEERTLILEDESGFYLLPGVVRTYAPRGITPTLYEWQTRDHLSVMGGLTPQGKLYTLARQESLNGLHSIAFLEHLMRHAGERLGVIWDQSPIHRRIEVQDFIKRMGRKRLWVESLPAYAPDLNPTEWLWRHMKQVEMRNTSCIDLEDLHEKFHLVIARVRQKPRLIQSFFHSAGLEIHLH